MRSKPRIYFVYRKSKAQQGSTVMRAHQLVRLLQPVIGERYDLRLLAMPAGKRPFTQRLWALGRPAGGVYFFTKPSIGSILPETMDTLRRKGAGVCLDHVDSNLKADTKVAADIHICTSYAQRALIEELQANGTFPAGKPMLLLHNADLRIYNRGIAPRETFRAVYCGTPELGLLTPAIRKRLDVLPVDSARAMEQAIKTLPEYTLHHCVRVREEGRPFVIRPFTKGFTAALCGANMIVSGRTADAVEFLGVDYPYLIQDDDESLAIEALDRAAEDFGGPEWGRGLERMSLVADRVSARALAAQLEDIMAELDCRR